MDAGASMPPEEVGDGYSGAAVAGAVLGTFLLPFLALIAALVLQGGQPDPAKRTQLRTWAWASGGWLVFESAVMYFLATVTL